MLSNLVLSDMQDANNFELYYFIHVNIWS